MDDSWKMDKKWAKKHKRSIDSLEAEEEGDSEDEEVRTPTGLEVVASAKKDIIQYIKTGAVAEEAGKAPECYEVGFSSL